jgi:murein DD-endopeptidase MepM/ murein hydrolase activator NlpD
MRRPPPAVGDPSPAWPLLDPARGITDDLGDCRPVKACKAGHGERHHAGEDLPAARGTIIVAPEAGEVIEVRPSWYHGTGLLLLQTDTGVVINLGEIEPHSEEDFGIVNGSRVVKGQQVARVGWHKMLHFETYKKGTRDTAQWDIGTDPPPSLLDPIPYLRAAKSAGAAPPPPRVEPGPVEPEPIPVDPNRPRSSSGGGGLGLVALLALGIGVTRRRRRAA